jgi:hypothetical protein
MQMMPVWMDRADAASDLTLAPNLSFDDDSSPNFPIQGKQLSEGSKPSGEATVIFFGTANCWNQRLGAHDHWQQDYLEIDVLPDPRGGSGVSRLRKLFTRGGIKA